MRFFEMILTFANIMAFCTLVIKPLHTIRWIGYVIPVALVVAIIEMVAEGFRWQMIPAYTLTVIFFVCWLLNKVIAGALHVNRVVSFLGFGFGVIAIVISIALPAILPVFSFPKPTGLYEIGTITYHWVDTSRPELFTAEPNDHRELMVQVWYPAKKQLSVQRVPYIQNPDAMTPAIGRLLHMPEFVFSHLKYVTSNAVAFAPIADDKPSYPLLIYLSGINGFRSVNTFQIEELVSHGYIVIGLDQPGIAPVVCYPDGRQIFGLSRNEIIPLIMQSTEAQAKAPTLHGQPMPYGIIPYFAEDASFALEQLDALNKSDPNHILTGRLDLEHAGIFGVSLGGMDAAQASFKDSRLKACLIIDSQIPAEVVEKGLKQPTMFITRHADTMRLERDRNGSWAEKDIELTISSMRAVYESLPDDGYYVQIADIFHINFTDTPYWIPIMSQLGWAGPINTQRGFDIVNAYSLAFFDKELKGQPTSLLSGQSKEYPEANLELRPKLSLWQP